MIAYYGAYHIPTRTLHYRRLEAERPIDVLLRFDKWNAQAAGTWQFYGVVPGYAAPRDLSRYTDTTEEAR